MTGLTFAAPPPTEKKTSIMQLKCLVLILNLMAATLASPLLTSERRTTDVDVSVLGRQSESRQDTEFLNELCDVIDFRFVGVGVTQSASLSIGTGLVVIGIGQCVSNVKTYTPLITTAILRFKNTVWCEDVLISVRLRHFPLSK
ncbi:hypothetical protein BJ165DRAFT_1592824 [Panaeolus papilionaceus]|nr:hypothetical protein BJ165DRAFT_1592824 [Panaeolus papilionaceus]